MVPEDLIHKYDWVTDPKLDAWAVAVVERRTVDEVLRIYGGDPTAPVRHGDHVVAIENNGWSGSLPEIARGVRPMVAGSSASTGTSTGSAWSPRR